MRAHRAIALLVLLLILPLLLPAPTRAQIQAVSLVQNLPFPLHVCAPPGDTQRLFILGQKGEIWIVKDGTLLPSLFLDLTGEVLSDSFEQGLLGLTFHPGYAVNGQFYVNFTTGTGAGRSVVRRYTVSANPDSADESSGQTVLELVQPQVNHNGGHVLFGPDGYLWIGFGDGGFPASASQDPQQFLGKMLRIDVNADDFPGDPLRNYAIPPDNPFVGDPTTLDEIWALGLRNPWRYHFDSLTGDLWIGDVGRDSYEEVDFVPAGDPGGMNFGWPMMEGFACFDPPTDCNDGTLTLPIYDYPHTPLSNHAIVGGYVYRGTELPAFLRGHYFFADESWQRIWSFRYENGVVSEMTDWTAALDVGNSLKFPACFWEDEAGELYVVEYRTAALGEVWKIVPDPSFVGVEPQPARPGGLAISAARPNPFTEGTHFEVRGAIGGGLRVDVHDAAGRLVRRLHRGAGAAGPLSLVWDGRDDRGTKVASGVYFLSARAGEQIEARRVTFAR